MIRRLLRLPEPAKGSRADQVTERFRASEVRMERQALAIALEHFTEAVSGDTAHGLSERLGQAREEAGRVLRWAAMREQAREISQRNGIR